MYQHGCLDHVAAQSAVLHALACSWEGCSPTSREDEKSSCATPALQAVDLSNKLSCIRTYIERRNLSLNLGMKHHMMLADRQLTSQMAHVPLGLPAWPPMLLSQVGGAQ